MKKNIILLSLSLFFIATSVSFAQKKDKSIITPRVGVNYHEKAELERMNKGEMVTLYIQRIASLVELLPYIAFTTKPGVTMVDLGIPKDNSKDKLLEGKYDSTREFLLSNAEFQKEMLPYSDKGDLIAAILFYEQIMKELHSYADFH